MHPARAIRTVLVSLLWLTLAIGLGLWAFRAANYSALTYFYYDAQHRLFEEIIETDPLLFSEEREGKLVRVRGDVSADDVPKDPDYHLSAQGLRIQRRVQLLPPAEGTEHAPASPPPEPHLTDRASYAKGMRIGLYLLDGPGRDKLRLPRYERHVASIMTLPPALRDSATISGKELTFSSADGSHYSVRFWVDTEAERSFLGRQRGLYLTTSPEELWRAEFMKEHAPATPFKTALNTGFFLLLSWVAALAALCCLCSAFRLPLSMREWALSALMLAIISALSSLGLLIDKGALLTNPIFDHTWRGAAHHCFEPGHFDSAHVATAHRYILFGMGLCLLPVALPPALKRLRRMRTKKA